MTASDGQPGIRSSGHRGEHGSLRIFLNYRREDSSGHAGRLYDDLAGRYAQHEVFIDIDKIEPGLDFGETIEGALDHCDVVLALIGRQWLKVVDGTGRRRLDDPDDYVRLELEAALARGTRLIPICVQGSEMPSSSELPESLRALARRHAVEVRDTRWHSDVESLASVLERLSSEKAERERREREQLEREHAERERLAHETEKERLERERLASEKGEREREERARIERQNAEQERTAQAAERARQERARREQEKAEREQAKRAERARREQERKARAELERTRRPRVATTEVGRSAWSRRRVAVGATVVLGLAAVIGFALVDRGGSAQTEEHGPSPISLAPPAISGSARAGSTLTARRGTWEHAPSRFAYEWRRCNPSGTGCAAIRAATGPRYKLRRADVGRRVRLSVTASNEMGSRTGTSEPTPIVEPALEPPTSLKPPSVLGTAREGALLTMRTGTWSGARVGSIETRWLRCKASGAGCRVIVAARGATYAVGASDVGRTIRVQQSASNPAGRTVVRSRPTATVRAKLQPSRPPTPIPSRPEPEPEPPPTKPIEPVPPPLDP